MEINKTSLNSAFSRHISFLTHWQKYGKMQVMNTEKNKQKVTVLIPFEIVTQIKHEAQKHQRSFNGELVWALQQYLEQQKDKK